MKAYDNFENHESTVDEEIVENEDTKIEKVLKEMKKYIGVKNRKPPRIFGNTIVLLRNNNKAILTIGPHFGFTICLFVTILLISVGVSILVSMASKIVLILGIIISSSLLLSFALVALVSPGHPTFEVTEQQMNIVKDHRRHWCKH